MNQPLSELINSAQINHNVDLPQVTSALKSVQFNQDKTTGLYSYSYWGNRSRSPQYPMRNEWDVKTWKTLAGAKRYFLSMYG